MCAHQFDIFSLGQKLQNFEQTPRNGLWAKLDAELDGVATTTRTKKKKVIWLAVAASISLIIVSVSFWVARQQQKHNGTTIAIEKKDEREKKGGMEKNTQEAEENAQDKLMEPEVQFEDLQASELPLKKEQYEEKDVKKQKPSWQEEKAQDKKREPIRNENKKEQKELNKEDKPKDSKPALPQKPKNNKPNPKKKIKVNDSDELVAQNKKKIEEETEAESFEVVVTVKLSNPVKPSEETGIATQNAKRKSGKLWQKIKGLKTGETDVFEGIDTNKALAMIGKGK